MLTRTFKRYSERLSLVNLLYGVVLFSCNVNHPGYSKTGLFTTSVFTPADSFSKGIEGPAVDRNNNLYAVNFRKQGTIGKVTPEGQLALFTELPGGSVGNGIRFNKKGGMLVADYTNHNILKVDMATRQVSVFAHVSGMNQPNDIAIDGNGRLYASDPNWKERSGQIWRIDSSGKATLLESNMGTANGIDVSPDDKILYVNETVQRKVWAYDLSGEGEISNKRLLIEFPDFGLDGMRCDVQGNLYIARHGKGTIVKVSPGGKVIREVTLMGKKPSNIAFGGKDGCQAFVTIQDNGTIETFRVDHPGREWKLMR